jgi:hypothetical protein
MRQLMRLYILVTLRNNISELGTRNSASNSVAIAVAIGPTLDRPGIRPDLFRRRSSPFLPSFLLADQVTKLLVCW